MSAEESTLLQSIAIAKELKEQNEELNSAFDEFKKEYLALEEELIHLRKEHHHEIQAKKTLEVDCQKLYKKWNEELQIQAQKFEKIQSEMIPNTELDLLRVQIMEDLEISYTKKLDWMKNEMEKYQNLYTKTLRESEILKLNHQNTKQSFDNTLNEEKQASIRQINKLKHENETLKQQNLHNDSHISLKQQIQKLHTENMEQNQKIQCLLTQISSLNQQNSKLNLEIEETKCLNISKVKESEGKLLIKNAEHNALKQRYNDVRTDYEQIKEKHLSKVHELQKLENNHHHLMTQMEQKKQEILSLNDSLKQKETAMKQQYDKECNVWNEKMKTLENDLQSANIEKESVKTEINTLRNQHLMEIQQLKQQHFTNFNQTIESKQELDKQYQFVKSKLTELQHQSENEIDVLHNELDKEKMKTQQIQKEKENLSELHNKKDKEIEDLMNNMQCLKKENTEITNEYQTLTNTYRDILDVNYQMTSKETKYVTQIEYLENDINEINKKIENKMKNVKLEYENKIKEMSDDKSGHEKSLNKVKKEKAKYKKLATAAKMKVNTLSKELINIKKNFQTELKGKDIEITNLSKQMHQLVRERDEIRYRQTMTSNNKQMCTSNHEIELITNNVDSMLKELEMEQSKANSTRHSSQQPNVIDINS